MVCKIHTSFLGGRMSGLRRDFLQELHWLFLLHWDKRHWSGHRRTNRQGNKTDCSDYIELLATHVKKKKVKHWNSCDNSGVSAWQPRAVEAVPLTTACFKSWIARRSNDVLCDYNIKINLLQENLFARHITAQVSQQVTSHGMTASGATALGSVLFWVQGSYRKCHPCIRVKKSN